MNTPTKPKSAFNPWPVAIIAYFAVAICAAVGFVIFCTWNKADLVATDYYEQELEFQTQLDRAHRAASLEAPATIAYSDTARRISISLPVDHFHTQLKGWIQLYRPSAANLDQRVPLAVNAAGEQTIDAANLATGLWHVRVSWTVNGADYYCDQKLVVGQKPS